MSLSVGVQDVLGAWTRMPLPSGYRHTHSVFGGPESCSFQVHRDTRQAYPDIGAYAPLYVMLAGAPVWSGRMSQTPTERAANSVFQIQGEGWYRQLFGKPVDKTWVVSDLSRWKPTLEQGSGINPAQYDHGASISMDGGAITMSIGKGGTIFNGRIIFAITLDLGPNNVAKRIVVKWAGSNNLGPSGEWGCQANNSTDPFNPTARSFAFTVTSPGSGTTTAGTFTTGYRYVHLYMYWSGADTVTNQDAWQQVRSAIVFTDAADESGNASALVASTVVGECLGLGVTPNISPSTADITTTTFAIPHFPADKGRAASGDLIQSINAYHAYQFFLSRDVVPRATYRPVPTVPEWVINDRDAYTLSNGSANDASEIVSEVIVQYTTAAGTMDEVICTAATGSTLVQRRNDVNTKVLAPSSPMTAAAATQLGNIYLAVHRTAPFKANASLTGTITNLKHGYNLPLALLPAGDAVLLGAETDPDTGGRGRIGIITQVDYEHESLKAALTIDSTRDFLDALLERMGVAVRS